MNYRNNSTTEPKVSVIIPIYNVENYIEQCLCSVKEQTLRDIEVICVDDASTDDSYRIAQEIIGCDVRFELFHLTENKGQSYARNYGMQKATGKYLYFMDSDDYLEIGALEKLYLCAEREKVQGVFFGMQKEYEDNAAIKELFTYSEYETIFTGRRFLAEVSKRGEVQVFAACGQFWLREYIEENRFRFYEGVVYEDNLYTLQVLLKAERVMSVKDILYHYRKGIASTTGNMGKDQLKSYMVIYYEIFKLWLDVGDSDEVSVGIKERLDTFHRRMSMAIGQLGYIPDMDFKESACQYLYRVITKVPPNYKYVAGISHELSQKLNTYDSVFVYGAAVIADEVIRALEENGQKIDGIIVTHRKSEREIYKGYCVYELEEVQRQYRKVMIVLGLSKRHHKEVTQRIEQYGYEWCNILCD